MVIVGGGTTGVEVAAAFTEIYNHALRDEFPELDFSQARITFVEAGDALLPAFHPRLQQAALRMLSERAADVRFRSQVAEVGPASVTLTDGSELAAGTVSGQQAFRHRRSRTRSVSRSRRVGASSSART